MNALLRGGPVTCPKKCDECEGSDHHWLGVTPDDEEEAKHEANTKHGLDAWWACRHCDAWIEDFDEEEEY